MDAVNPRPMVLNVGEKRLPARRKLLPFTANLSHLFAQISGDQTGSGRTAVFTGTTIYRLDNGKIAELWYNADTMGLFAQLGAPSPLA